MKEGGSVGGKEARSLKPENPWNENISFAKHDLKTDQVYGLFGSHQSGVVKSCGSFFRYQFGNPECCVFHIRDYNTFTHA